MGNYCCPPDNKSENDEPDERSRLLPEPPRQNYTASNENSIINEPTESDDQAVLTRIVQDTQESLIDVAAFDQHALEHHEYVDRSRMYATRINNEFERQIRDAILKTSRTRAPNPSNNGAVQRLADLQTETQTEDAALMQQLAADFEQRLANCGIKLIGDLVVRVTGERNAQPMYLGQPGSAFVPTTNHGNMSVAPVPTNMPPVGLMPASSNISTANA